MGNKNITIGITAHVDSGKTTLAEAMLYITGEIRKLGRVDNGSSFLDTDSIERDRGITIFASQAEFTTGGTHVTLLDTPGHVDFSAETERTMCVIDYAVLVISGTDGVQSHTSTLWKLLKKYEVPVFIFVNKMDLVGAEKDAVFEKLRNQLSGHCIDFSDYDNIYENSAACDEELMNRFFDSGLSDNDITKAISHRKIFPCFFGSALKMQGIDEFITLLDKYTAESDYNSDFGLKVYKISYDSKGTRLTHLRVMGGELKVRSELTYKTANGEEITEKISAIRFYSGEKFHINEIAVAGEICAVAGLSGTYSGQGIGSIENSGRTVLEPVMTYRIEVPEDKNIYEVLKDMKCLEDTDPQLHIVWHEQLKEIHIQLMGAVQIEVLSRIIDEKYGYSVTFSNGTVAYKETIVDIAEGVGHYEPLKHYAEVHLLLEPLPRNSGLRFDTAVSEDKLDRNWQRLILTHLEEKTHIGVLTGSPVTDMKITLVAGKAHLKHTEGGDFRQATYRAVRQGLRCAQSVLLEPYYDYELEIPSEYVGRAISDLQRMSADFSSPETVGEMTVIKGSAPVSEMNDYQADIISYTRGKGRISCINGGYRECHNSDEIISTFSYNADSDTDNSADSIFCSHGAGYNVKWYDVPNHMHLSSYLQPEKEEPEQKAYRFVNRVVSDSELLEIFERTYGKINSEPRKAFKSTKIKANYSKPVSIPNYDGSDYLIVDGYNIIFAWDELKKIAEKNLNDARMELAKILCNYQGYTGYEIILVFDAYKVKRNHRDIEKFHNINIIYTKERETADTYIECISHELTKKHRVRVATSDGAEQLIILGNGAMRISANELHKRILDADKAIRDFIGN
ncbi:MAG: TetM/TetW/TetO/TetS family tetracycline resistance ribosomal protection protein [Ruminococcus sp.]|nr:TetM/TetW/TetO/TetS family tetracycline resistance ribosomal protection protein [Ruminococcus sp.]